MWLLFTLCSFPKGRIRVGVWGCRRRYSKLPCCIFPGLCRRPRVIGIELFFLLVLSLAGRQILIRTFVWKFWIFCTCHPGFPNPWRMACIHTTKFSLTSPFVKENLLTIHSSKFYFTSFSLARFRFFVDSVNGKYDSFPWQAHLTNNLH